MIGLTFEMIITSEDKISEKVMGRSGERISRI